MKHILLYATCLLTFVTSAAPTMAAEEGGVGAAMTVAMQKFIGSLDEKSLALAAMKFDDPKRMDWHNIPKANRKGFAIKDMSVNQRELCHGLLHTALSDSGYDKVRKIMSLENNVREGERGKADISLRDSGRYYVTFFGKPDNSGTWGWSFEGHHVSLNFVIRDGKVVSDTPTFFGANPATIVTFISEGPAVGTRALAEEEQTAFDLVNALNDSQRTQAIIAERAPADYRAAGKPQPPTKAAEGIPAADMTDAQKKLLRAVIEASSSHLVKELSDARMAQIDTDGIDHVYFAWAGGTMPATPHYFRVQGPSFLLELVNFQSDPSGNPANHIHSVWRNMHGDFDVPIK